MIKQTERLALDIDLRLRWLWDEIAEAKEKGKLDDLTLVATFVRAAYGQGYVDALKEPHGTLQRENGFTVPPKLDEFED